MMPWLFWLALVALIPVVLVIGAVALAGCWAIERMVAAEYEDEP